ncbi:MAG: nitrate reductase subunit beta [Candidatus Dormibacteraeota bacterium]|nr:nitrate reductase subunit beta [Candidatus Dormibacteraeota bacterium]MBO0760038.1 nitrate reductase subunit beta [Candidatus Dormibacteraeota bacterium]
MRVRAQVGMVMNLDKCIGCHTCSVTCKQVWTNRSGTEYVWFNNVETKPGLGYPRRWEDNEKWRGGWELDRKGRLRLKAGGQLRKLITIFSNPDLPSIDDYYEPWTYDYETLINAPLSERDPVARPHSQLTGQEMSVQAGPNWDDMLAGAPETAPQDPDLRGIEEHVKLAYEQAFMFYLPRICEHCLNPSCVASCPSGAMYKREEDGIVLVDQDKCRGWRFCVSGCPYKKVYFNHHTGKAEKCTLCYPRIEAGLPTICSETCVGRIRYLGIVLYDADRVLEAASVRDEKDLLEAQLSLFLDPADPEVQAQARRDGVPDDWLEHARRSPVYTLAIKYRVALPLHPEYRTLPMVWYVPPLSPVVNVLEQDGYEADPDDIFPAIERMRIPVEYLANLLAAGDADVVRGVLQRLAAMRTFMRKQQVLGEEDVAAAAAVGMEPPDLESMYRLLAIAKYEDRYVIPQAHTELAQRLAELPGTCGLDFEGGPGNCGALPRPEQALNQNFMLTERKGAGWKPLPVVDPGAGEAGR